MRISFSLLIFLYSNTCLAAVIADEFCYSDGKCHQAVDKAQEAFLKQIGYTDLVSSLQSYGESKVKSYLNKAKIDRPIAAAGYVYKVVQSKSISIPCGKGRRLNLTTSSASISIPIP